MSHPENTFRALKDLPPFVERWQCRIGLHRWLKWSDPKKSPSDLYFRQHTFCADCNKAKIVKVNVPL